MKNKIIGAIGIAFVTAASTILIAYFKDVQNREYVKAQAKLYQIKANKQAKKVKKQLETEVTELRNKYGY